MYYPACVFKAWPAHQPNSGRPAKKARRFALIPAAEGRAAGGCVLLCFLLKSFVTVIVTNSLMPERPLQLNLIRYEKKHPHKSQQSKRVPTGERKSKAAIDGFVQATDVPSANCNGGLEGYKQRT